MGAKSYFENQLYFTNEYNIVLNVVQKMTQTI